MPANKTPFPILFLSRQRTQASPWFPWLMKKTVQQHLYPHQTLLQHPELVNHRMVPMSKAYISPWRCSESLQLPFKCFNQIWQLNPMGGPPSLFAFYNMCIIYTNMYINMYFFNGQFDFKSVFSDNDEHQLCTVSNDLFLTYYYNFWMALPSWPKSCLFCRFMAGFCSLMLIRQYRRLWCSSNSLKKIHLNASTKKKVR